MVIVFGPRSEGFFAVDRVGKVAMGIVACLRLMGMSARQALWPCPVRGPDRALEDGFVEGRRRMIEDRKMEICRSIKDSSEL
jgi:hypothetical protein